VLLAASVSLSGEPDAGTTLSTAKNPDLGIDQTYKAVFCRGRDTGYPVPPAQIRT
jgi:hypothetical protein